MGHSKLVLVVDYGAGNIQSVTNAFHRLSQGCVTADFPDEVGNIDEYSMIVLPGVGSFDYGITSLKSRGWDAWLKESVANGVALLGLCLGMQLLCDGSSEGEEAGLGIIGGKFERFACSDESGHPLKVPHMGWNDVSFDLERAPWARIESSPRFYFVHSYRLIRENVATEVGWTDYGEEFVSAIASGRTIGLQFHPEKSHKHGLQLLKNIVSWSNA